MSSQPLQAPFPYFGGKRTVADLVWDRFGNVPNYVEPFFGSGAVLLMRPHDPGIETVNDACGFVANFWRAVQSDPEAVAKHADNPVNENDLHARHAWLVGQTDGIQSRLEGDPDWFDAKVAGWWCWGLCCWIGRGFCSGEGPWCVVNGELVNSSDAGRGVNRQRVHLGNAGRGVNRQLVHLLNAGMGVNRKRVHLGDAGQGVREWMQALADRLRRVRVCCGDWSRVCGNSATVCNGLTGVFLDPPYADTAERDNNLYRIESTSVAHDVREWAIAHGTDPLMRIALCGYEGEHVMPPEWECLPWKARGGYASQSDLPNDNATRERIWFSPSCLRPEHDAPLFAMQEDAE
jgi:DNA adenine methylase